MSRKMGESGAKVLRSVGRNWVNASDRAVTTLAKVGCLPNFSSVAPKRGESGSKFSVYGRNRTPASNRDEIVYNK